MDNTAVKNTETLYGEQYDHNIASVEDPIQCLEHHWYIDGYWKLIIPETNHLAAPNSVLDGLQHDPTETNELADANRKSEWRNDKSS